MSHTAQVDHRPDDTVDPEAFRAYCTDCSWRGSWRLADPAGESMEARCNAMDDAAEHEAQTEDLPSDNALYAITVRIARTKTLQPPRPETPCGCGFALIWVNSEWQHDAAPGLWGDDHDPDAPVPIGPARDYWDRYDAGDAITWESHVDSPTFYLDPSVQGIVSEDHAQRIVRNWITEMVPDAEVFVTAVAL